MKSTPDCEVNSTGERCGQHPRALWTAPASVVDGGEAVIPTVEPDLSYSGE